MVQTIDAVFDGKFLRPEGDITLPANTRVRLTIESAEPGKSEPGDFLRTAMSLRLDGPEDWSENFKGYLSGERKLPE